MPSLTDVSSMPDETFVSSSPMPGLSSLFVFGGNDVEAYDHYLFSCRFSHKIWPIS